MAHAPIYDFSPEGSLVLVVGQEPNVQRLHISVNRMKRASSVFKAMLGGQFAEGRAMATATARHPAHIWLPEDDPDAMFCLVSFVRRNLGLFVPEILYRIRQEPTLLRSIAIAADKYDMTVPIVRAWYRAIQNGLQSTPESLAHDLQAAQYLDEPTFFYTMTKSALLNHEGPFELLFRDAEDRDFANTMISALEKARETEMYFIARTLYSHAHGINEDKAELQNPYVCSARCRGCKYAARFPSLRTFYDYVEEITRNGHVWQRSESVSVRKIMLRCKSLLEDETAKVTDQRCRHKRSGVIAGYLRQLQANVAVIEKRYQHDGKGLCLRCILGNWPTRGDQLYGCFRHDDEVAAPLVDSRENRPLTKLPTEGLLQGQHFCMSRCREAR